MHTKTKETVNRHRKEGGKATNEDNMRWRTKQRRKK
jgi:hypothetical protein